MRIPTATYRLQLHAHFGLAHVARLVPYFHTLGISHLYLSPIFQARAGSTHGYDVTDPTRVNPEIGSEEELRALAAELRRRGMGILLDIVPNHMAADVQNPWWRDVLEHGTASPFAGYFDVDWGAADGRLILPVLGRHYGDAIEAGELKLELGPEGLVVAYFDRRLPLDPGSWPEVLTLAGDDAPEGLRDIVTRLRGLAPRDEARADAADRRYREAQALKNELWTRHEADVVVRTAVDRALAAFDVARAGDAAARRLDALLAHQPYLPAFWKTASEEINYRRFFDITDLAGVRVEEPEVFEATHRLVIDWVHDGTIEGVRVDHVDGLFDPTAYLQRLADRAGGPYLLVEKILARDERLPDGWPVAGTTGYDALNLLNGLFIDADGLTAVDRAYRRFAGDRRQFRDTVHAAKRQVMKELFGGEVHTLVGALIALAHHDRHGRDLPAPALGRALQELTAALPVYRTYARAVEGAPLISARDEHVLRETLREARRRNRQMDPGIFDFLERVLLVAPRDETAAGRLAFLMRWQQFTGPVMAKGLEDTALYRWPALLSACEVGAWPPVAPVTPAELHERAREGAARWSHALSTLSTHDTKRSGDARARLNVLTEIPDEWAATLARWADLNEPKRVELEDGWAPSPVAEVSIYQMLLGAWSASGPDAADLPERIKKAILKSAREAKTRTNWHHPAEEYERVLLAFVDALLEDGRFLDDFRAFEARIAIPGMLNGLSQTLLSITLPGVPDVYQGTETWRFSLVDPDNRRPVDFGLRERMLRGVLGGGYESESEGESESDRETSRAASNGFEHEHENEHEHDGETHGATPGRGAPAEWLREWRDGRIKLHVTAAALRFRRGRAALFSEGEYIPVEVSGARAECAFAFARRLHDEWCLVVAPRLTTRLAQPGELPVAASWGDAALRLPAGAPSVWRDALGGGGGAAQDGMLSLRQLLAELPLALLTSA